MLPFAHISSGYLVYASVAQRVETNNIPLLSVALAGALAPDIDGLFGAQMKDHRNTIFHAPLFWLSIFVVTYGVGVVYLPVLKSYILAFFFSIFVHHVLDWFSARTSGIRVLYPFSKKNYACFPLQPDRGTLPTLPDKQHFRQWVEFWKFYFSRKVLISIELLVTISPLFVYMAFR